MTIETAKCEKIILHPLPIHLDKKDFLFYANADKSLGTLQHIEYRCDSFNMWLISYKLVENTILSVRIPGYKTLSLSYTLGENVHYTIKGLSPGVSKKGYFNMFFLPDIEVAYNINAGEQLLMFGIAFPKQPFAGTQVPKQLAQFLDKVEDEEPCILREKDFLIVQEMNVLIEQLTTILITAKLDNSFLIQGMAYTLASKSFEEAASSSDEEEQLFKKILDFINKNLADRQLNVARVADQFQVSHVYIRKLFKNRIKTVPVKFIIGQRMTKGAQLLKSGRFSIKKVAAMVGYSDPSNFSTAFFHQFQKWPTDFIREK